MVMLLNAESKTPLADGIKNVIFRQRMNYSIIITGAPQKRKSTTGVKLAMEIDAKFNLEKDMAVIKTKDMLEVLDMKAKRGGVKFLDELGVGMNHRTWFSFLNQAMSYIMQTHGHEGKVVIVTAPYQDYVDNDARKLFNMIIEIERKNDKEGFVMAKVAEIQYNQKLKKIYYKLPRIRYPNGVVKRVAWFKIKYPSKEVLDRYFAISNEKKETLKNELVKEATIIERKGIKQHFNPTEYVKKIEAEPEKFVNDSQGRRYISRDLIMNEFSEIGEMRARIIKAKAERELKEKLNLGKKYERKGSGSPITIRNNPHGEGYIESTR